MEQQPYLRVSSPLDDKNPFFQLKRIQGTEGLCQNFEYNLTLSSSKTFDFSEILGRKISVTLAFPKKGQREINGFVTKIVEKGHYLSTFHEKVFLYHCELRPGLWELSLARDHRIFQGIDNTGLKIVQKLLQDYGFSDFENTCSRFYEDRPFCVMYDESIMNFFCRMMEREGIFWYWKHQKGDHILVVGDHIDLVPKYPYLSKAQLQLKKTHWTHSDHISSLEAQGVIIPSEYMVCDYTYKNAPRIQQTLPMPTGTGKLKVFEYPANFNSLKGASHRVKERNYAYQALQNIILGTSYVRSFTAGHRFTLSAPDRKEDQKEFVIYRLSLDASQNSYENTFEAIPTSLPFHPLPVTPKPKIYLSKT